EVEVARRHTEPPTHQLPGHPTVPATEVQDGHARAKEPPIGPLLGPIQREFVGDVAADVVQGGIVHRSPRAMGSDQPYRRPGAWSTIAACSRSAATSPLRMAPST